MITNYLLSLGNVCYGVQKLLGIYLIVLVSVPILAQEPPDYFITPEVLVGYTAPSNEDFPDRNLQTQAFLSFAWNHAKNTKEWARRFKTVKTGISLGYTDFGNSQSLGGAISLMPFLEFNAFKSKRFKAHIGLGGSYFTEEFDMDTNFFNRAVSTDFTWSLRAFLNYTVFKRERVNYNIGLGIFHHSNGHTRLPNNGFNSFLVSASTSLKRWKKTPTSVKEVQPLERSRHHYITIRKGIGQSVLNDGFPFNEKKEVYTLSAEYGRVYNNIFKVGIGAFYRLYEHYYDYIRDNESLVQDGREFAAFRENPWDNASNYGVFVKGEVQLNHIGIELMVGANFHKPAYRIDWRINEGWDFAPRDIPDFWVLGEFNSKFEFKNAIPARLGVKYYLFGTDTFTKHNLYGGVFINANLGQADFTELALGYVYQFKRKIKS